MLKDPTQVIKFAKIQELLIEKNKINLKFLGRVFYHDALFRRDKNWPNNDKIVLGKHKIFTKALAKIFLKNHKESAMNEVHILPLRKSFYFLSSAVQLSR